MKASHVNPEEAVLKHRDIRAGYSAAIHWGAFSLTNEPMEEPPNRIRESLKEAQITEERFFLMRHGETRILDFLYQDNPSSK